MEDENVSSEPKKVPLNMDSSTWEGWFNAFIIWAAQNPGEFLYYVLLGLSPFFLLSLLLSWKLAKALEAQEKEKKKKAKRESNISKTRKGKTD